MSSPPRRATLPSEKTTSTSPSNNATSTIFVFSAMPSRYKNESGNVDPTEYVGFWLPRYVFCQSSWHVKNGSPTRVSSSVKPFGYGSLQLGVQPAVSRTIRCPSDTPDPPLPSASPRSSCSQPTSYAPLRAALLRSKWQTPRPPARCRTPLSLKTIPFPAPLCLQNPLQSPFSGRQSESFSIKKQSGPARFT